MEHNFLERLDEAPRCPNRKLHNGQEMGRLNREVTRLSRVGDVFAVEIDRTRPVPELPSGLTPAEIDMHFRKASDNPFTNRIRDFESINLQDWANGRDIDEKPDLGESAPRTEELTHMSIQQRYHVCAIVAYSRQAFHYTCFVKIDGRWTYFDDLKEYPVFRDPFSDWPKVSISHTLHRTLLTRSGLHRKIAVLSTCRIS